MAFYGPATPTPTNAPPPPVVAATTTTAAALEPTDPTSNVGGDWTTGIVGAGTGQVPVPVAGQTTGSKQGGSTPESSEISESGRGGAGSLSRTTTTTSTPTAFQSINPTQSTQSTQSTLPLSDSPPSQFAPGTIAGFVFLGVFVAVLAAFVFVAARRSASTRRTEEAKNSYSPSDSLEPQPGLRSIEIIATPSPNLLQQTPTPSPSLKQQQQQYQQQAIHQSSTLPLVLARLPFPVDESGPCALHPLATEKHSLKDCHKYRRLVTQKRFDELEKEFILAELTARRAEASALGFNFPVQLDRPCALHPAATGEHAHVLQDCRKYRTLVQQKRFKELEQAFKEAANVVEAVQPFTGSAGVLSFPYIINEDAPCALHPTATGEKKHTLGNCYTYRRLVQAKKFDELEEALNQAALKVEAVRRVTFVSPVPSNPSSSASTSSPHPSNTTPTPAQNQPQPLAPKRLKSIAEKSVFSKATTASEGGYNPETTSSYDGTYKTRETTPRRRLSGLNKAGLWWKNATSGTRPQRPPVGVTRAVRSSPVPSVRSGSGHSSSGTNPRRAGMSGSASASEGYVTAPEYRSGSASETEGGYHTAQEVMYTSGTERYYTAEEGEEDD